MATALIHDSAYLRHDTGRHPESALRLKAILPALQADEALWCGLHKVTPQAATEEDVMRCHTGWLFDHLHDLCERGVPFVDLDTVICRESFDIAMLAAGAATTAVDEVFSKRVQNAFAFIRPPGHHATSDRSMGFCLFNNAAIGARYAQKKYGAERVLIIDWDVHHGNGTQEIFYEDPTVFYFSTHLYPHYPGTGASSERGENRGEGATLNIPLRLETPARIHREAFADALKLVEERFPPDLIIISAGFDSRKDDPLGGLLLEDIDFRDMTRIVMDIADRHASGRVVSVLEGGYNLETLGETVRTHVAALAS